MKERPRLIQERVNCINALGKQLRTNDFRCRNTKWREGTSEKGRRTVQHAQSDKQKPVACLTRDSNPRPVLRQSIQTPMKCHRHTRWNQDAIYRFHIACYRVADVVFGRGPESYFLCRWWDYEISGGFGCEWVHLEIAVGGSEIRLCDESRAMRQNCFKGVTHSIIQHHACEEPISRNKVLAWRLVFNIAYDFGLARASLVSCRSPEPNGRVQ